MPRQMKCARPKSRVYLLQLSHLEIRGQVSRRPIDPETGFWKQATIFSGHLVLGALNTTWCGVAASRSGLKCGTPLFYES
jgi:hypothetical protein